MSTSGEDPSRPLQQSLSKIHLLSHSQEQKQSSSASPANRLFPPCFRRPYPFSLIPSSNYSNHSSATRTDLHSADTHSAFSKIPLKQTNETGNFKAKTSGQASIKGSSEAEVFSNPSSGLESSPGVNHCNNAKVSRPTKSGIQEVPDILNAASSCRYDSSLGLLTKKFVSLILEAKDGILDLNKTADVLEVQKRRIYDITNVLEGIGLIEKTTKNHIRWKGHETLATKELDDQVTRLKAEVESSYAEECRLDDCIREKLELLRAVECDEDFQKYLYLSEEDIMSLPCFKNQTLIAVKAPHASSVEVPDPDEDIGYNQQDTGFPHRQFKLIVRSTTGPIDLYLLSKSEGQYDDMTIKQVKSNGSSAWIPWNSDRYGVNTTEMSSGHQNNQTLPVDAFSSIDSKVPGIQKIMPSDSDVGDDYWFRSDVEVSATDLWSTQYP